MLPNFPCFQTAQQDLFWVSLPFCLKPRETAWDFTSIVFCFYYSFFFSLKAKHHLNIWTVKFHLSFLFFHALFKHVLWILQLGYSWVDAINIFKVRYNRKCVLSRTVSHICFLYSSLNLNMIIKFSKNELKSDLLQKLSKFNFQTSNQCLFSSHLIPAFPFCRCLN